MEVPLPEDDDPLLKASGDELASAATPSERRLDNRQALQYATLGVANLRSCACQYEYKLLELAHEAVP